jgi:hypothetical protein
MESWHGNRGETLFFEMRVKSENVFDSETANNFKADAINQAEFSARRCKHGAYA